MDDSNTTVVTLRNQVAAFTHERDWEQFHSPKDLAAGLTIEAAELLELFLWKTSTEVDAMIHRPDTRRRMGEELADVLILSQSCQSMKLTSQAVRAKLEANAVKSPVEKAKGSSQKYTDL